MTFCFAKTSDFSITLAAPVIPAGRCVALSGETAAGFFVSVAGQGCGVWELVRDFSAQLILTVKGDLAFLRQRCRRHIKRTWGVVKSLFAKIIPSSRIYSFRL